MIEIIFDEKAWCEEALQKRQLGRNPVGMLSRIAKYYYSLGHKRKEITRLLEEFILRCDPAANVLRWRDAISSCVKQADSRPLINLDCVTVTSAELDRIDQLQSVLARKVMFALLCLAKYRNAIRPNNDSWIGCEIKDVFRMAGVTMTRARQYGLINDLLSVGYLAMNRLVDNTSLRVLIINDESAPALRINDFRNLGNQYMRLSSHDYIECELCGLVIKQNSKRQKYCISCREDMRLQAAYAYRNKEASAS